MPQPRPDRKLPVIRPLLNMVDVHLTSTANWLFSFNVDLLSTVGHSQATISRGTTKSTVMPCPNRTSAQLSTMKSTTSVAPVG